MEIQKASTGIFYASRIFGLAPYLIQRNSKGRITEIKLSIILCIYSVLTLLITVYMTCRGLFNDAQSSSPTRMKSATSKIVTTIDVIVVVGACSFGVLCSIFGICHTQDLNRKLREVDEILSLYTDEIKDQRRSIFMMICIYAGITGMLGMDLGSRHQVAEKTNVEESAEVADVNVRGYIPFYILYYILMTLHIQLAQTAIGLGRRYRRLNTALCNLFLTSTSEKSTTKSSLIHLIGVQHPKLHSSVIDSSQLKKGTSLTSGQDKVYIKSSYFINRLAYAHEALTQSIESISGAYGLAIIALLISCLLQLVSTTYFLLVAIQLKKNLIKPSITSSIWIVFHLLRLLLIVEPYHKTSAEANKTIATLMKIIRNNTNVNNNDLLQFWRQLITSSRRHYFIASGVCTIDREILTALSGAIATYLIIFWQIRNE